MGGAGVMERFWSYVDMNDEDECWRWRGPMGKFGYGNFTVDGRKWRAHRFSYFALVGVVSDDLDLDHLCRRRECVNPAHLEPVTRQENIRRGESDAGRNARKTHCKRGHPFDEKNTRWSKKGRHCRKCHSERQSASDRAARAAARAARPVAS